MSNKTSGVSERSLYEEFRVGLMITFSVISLLADLIIGLTILRVKGPRSRTYLIILNWAINDGLFRLTNLILHYVYHFDVINSNNIGSVSVCAVTFIDTGFQLVSVGFIGALISTTVMKTLQVTNEGILLIFYMSGLAFTAFILYFCCIFTRLPVMPIILIVYFSIVAIILIFKEINKCCKRVDPLTVFRLNIARIFVYNWAISGLFFVLVHTDALGKTNPVWLEFGFLLGYLCSFYVLVYLGMADGVFKMSLLNAVRCKAADVDATIGFAENANKVEEVEVTIDEQ